MTTLETNPATVTAPTERAPAGVTTTPSRQPVPRRRRMAIVIVAGLCALAGAVIAISSRSSSSGPRVVLRATEYRFDGPRQATAGLTTLVLQNNGFVAHQAELLRLNPGVDAATLAKALHNDPNAWIGKSTPVGGPGGILHGQSQQVQVDLQPGTYVLACFLRGGAATGPNHAMLGMVMPLTVTGTGHQAGTPTDSGTAALTDGHIALPTGFGTGTYKVTNTGTQAHELNILALEPGKTVADFVAFLRHAAAPHGNGAPVAAPPFHNAGGFTAVSPGQSGWVQLSLPPGNYLATDFLPDVRTQIPDVAEGMLTPFTVGS